MSLFPGFALLIALASINVLVDHLRDVLNPRGQNK
jgi:ABC-type dipeptide/oligopeptide/nickel transport system permease subunit